MEEQLDGIEVVCRPRIPVRNGYAIGSRVWGPALHIARVIETGERTVEEGYYVYSDGKMRVRGYPVPDKD
jgi:hypothetical protein